MKEQNKPMKEEEVIDPYKSLKEAHKAGKPIELFLQFQERWVKIEGEPNWTAPAHHYRVPAYDLNMAGGNLANTGKLNVTGRDIIHRSVLQEAEVLINGDRAKQYGKASENFNDIAAGWSVLFKTKVTAEQVAIAMIWLKSCRFNHKDSRDSIVDIAGYAGCIEKIQKGL